MRIQLKLSIWFLSFPFFLSAQIDTALLKLLTSKPAIFVDTSILQRNYYNEGDGFPYHGIWRIVDRETGHFISVSEFKYGKQHGQQISFYENGQISHSHYYNSGVQQGPWIYFWSNGNVRNLGFYVNGKLDGLVRNFDTSGNLIRISEYKNGKRNGIDLRVYSSGNVEILTHYSEGEESGIRYEFSDIKGFHLKGEFVMRKSVPVSGKWYKDGIVFKTHIYDYEEELRKRERFLNQKGEWPVGFNQLLSDQ